jgi:hypothetical protein
MTKEKRGEMGFAVGILVVILIFTMFVVGFDKVNCLALLKVSKHLIICGYMSSLMICDILLDFHVTNFVQ